jgi:CRISPR-associated protein Csx3
MLKTISPPPAIVIAGPPHAGKSVLTHSLAKTLLAKQCAFYVMRAADDGEGHWSNEIDQKLAQDIRIKGKWTRRWINLICRDLSRRVLPLIVDTGGNPTPDQERVYGATTHAVLLTRTGAELEEWRARMHRLGVPVIAELRSELKGNERLDARSPLLRGVLTGLDRGSCAQGAVFAALVDEVVYALGGATRSYWLQRHLAHTPFDESTQLVDFDALLNELRPGEEAYCLPDDIPRALARIPHDKPLALYGQRSPAILIAQIAAQRNVRWQFDARLGWLRTPMLRIGARDELVAESDELNYALERRADGHTRLNVRLPLSYLDYAHAHTVPLPAIESNQHVEISGKCPNWLFAGIARAYRDCASVRVHNLRQPTRAAKPVCTTS